MTNPHGNRLVSIDDERIEDTFAEAFSMQYTRLVVTAVDRHWLTIAANAFCGYGTSVIGCDAECGVECFLDEAETPDGRPGVALLAFSFTQSSLEKAVVNRAGQCVMTCPTTAIYNGLNRDERIGLGRLLRFFGDGYQKSKLLDDRRIWRIPVMDGEFLVEEHAGVASGIGGGNLIFGSAAPEVALEAARVAAESIASLENCITPFPGGIARSGSKVGSRYRNQVASTADAFCPTLRGRVESKLNPAAQAAYEVVIDATGEQTIRHAMGCGIQAALTSTVADRILQITAGNYGGKLGKHLIELRSLQTPPDDGTDGASSPGC